MDDRSAAGPPIRLRYRARTIGPAELAVIRATIATHAAEGRTRISQVLCEAWDWRQPNGALKEYACRDLLLRLEERGYVTLPPRLRAPNGPCQQDRLASPPRPGPPLTTADLHTVVVRPVAPAERPQWKAYLAHYHYLGYQPGAGEQLGYVALLGDQLVGCLAWGAAAYRNGPREAYLGWDGATKRARLPLVVQNTRTWPRRSSRRIAAASRPTGRPATAMPSSWPRPSWTPPGSGGPTTGRPTGSTSTARRGPASTGTSTSGTASPRRCSSTPWPGRRGPG